MALVTASGPAGLSAFMPAPHAKFNNRAGPKRVHMTPVLPVTDTWQAADFSLTSVIGESEAPGSVNLRQYTVKLLARYLYVSGESPTLQVMTDDRSLKDRIPHDQ
jgi:3-O-alpha-D-mannopyranosyl-alpha-D-mannopyranose xylosylphosphotransferase